MSITFLIVALIIFGFLIPIFLVVYFFYLILGDFLGAPFVPTSNKLIDGILKEAGLKNGQKFVELGSGDGRVIRKAVKDFRVMGLGIEMHPWLVLYSKLVSRLQKIKGAQFKRGNFFKEDLKGADIVFAFLLTKTMEKLSQKFESELKKDALVISHGFKIKGWEKRLIKKIEGKPFNTYFYKKS